MFYIDWLIDWSVYMSNTLVPNFLLVIDHPHWCIYYIYATLTYKDRVTHQSNDLSDGTQNTLSPMPGFI